MNVPQPLMWLLWFVVIIIALIVVLNLFSRYGLL
jgi:TRAP-type C4-dicarboxylate transport system permease small subunit